jgi:hypothetical protein
MCQEKRAVGEKNSRGEPYTDESSEYSCGHNVNPLAYRRLHELDPEHRCRQYKILEPFLSPLSHPTHATQALIEAQQKKMEDMAKRIEALEVVINEHLTTADNARRRDESIRIEGLGFPSWIHEIYEILKFFIHLVVDFVDFELSCNFLQFISNFLDVFFRNFVEDNGHIEIVCRRSNIAPNVKIGLLVVRRSKLTVRKMMHNLP